MPNGCIITSVRSAPFDALSSRLHPSRRRDLVRSCSASYNGASFFTKKRNVEPKTAALYDLHGCLTPYTQAWAWQQKLVTDLLNSEDSKSLGSVLLVQHPPVLTLGAGSTEANLLFDPASPPLPLHRTERGGEATYHGPGQLVLYPIFNLNRLKPDLHWYLRGLEETVIRALETASGLCGEKLDGLTGVWVGGSKVAAIGIRAKRWVTYHGLALNVTTDLEEYRHIIPCGINDKPVTSVARLLKSRALTILPGPILLDQYADALLHALEDVFDFKLIEADMPQNFKNEQMSQ